ncbi:MAG: toll/interleukin-1 receptor domain-containing protein [Longimicrobiales bacterium]
MGGDRPTQFDAFICYSRQDGAFAAHLEQRLERYRPPRIPGIERRRLAIFRDKEDLVGADYYDAIERNLHASRKLIVLCSPAAAASEFVNDEIRRFAEAHGAENIIPVWLSGLPANEVTPGNEAENAFPAALNEVLDLPLAIPFLDVDPERERADAGRHRNSWHTLLASIYGIPRTTLEEREQRRERLARLLIMAGSAAGIAVALAIGILSRALFPAPADAQNEWWELRGLFEHALAATQQGWYDDAQDYLDEFGNRAERVRDWGPLRFPASADHLSPEYVTYLKQYQEAVLAVHRNSGPQASRASNTVESAYLLGGALGGGREVMAEFQTGLLASIARWGGGESYSNGSRGEAASGGGSSRPPEVIERERRELLVLAEVFGPSLNWFDGPPPRALDETRTWNGGVRAALRIEFEALPGPPREYLIEIVASDRSGSIQPEDVGPSPRDRNGDGRDDGEWWTVVVPATSGHVVYDIDWAGHSQNMRYARWRLASWGGNYWGLQGPWRYVDWETGNR